MLYMISSFFLFFFFFKQKTAFEMRISDWSSDVCSSDLVAIADRIATIPAHRPQDHITLEMAPLEIRHRSVRPISAKHAQASRFLQQSPVLHNPPGSIGGRQPANTTMRPHMVVVVAPEPQHRAGMAERHEQRLVDDRKSTRLNSSH